MTKHKGEKMKKQAVVTWGGWEGHQPAECAASVTGTLRALDFQVHLTDTLDVFMDSELMRGADLIVPVWTMGEISGAQLQGLLDTVRAGAGLAGFHGGMGDSFRACTEFQFMAGGQFVAHPGGIIDYLVRITRADDPVMAGLEDFTIRSEQYYMHVDPGNEVLATTTFSGEYDGQDWIAGTEMPVVWKRRYGNGRIFYSSLGHVAAELDIPEVAAILQRGMMWAARCE